MFTTATHFVQWDWFQTEEGRQVFTNLANKHADKRRIFGLLERPTFPAQMVPDEFQYKLFISGKSGVGKTSTVSRLTGNAIPETHSETPGIQTSYVYWPARLSDVEKIVMFQLQFWDAGESALKKFDHILPACKDRVDGIIFQFSFADKSSFEDLAHQMSRITSPDDNAAKFVIGTKLDLHTNEISQRQLQEFEQHHRLPVMTTKNVLSPDHNLAAEIREIAPVMNYICDQLWLRDQILAGRIQPPDPNGHPKISFC